MQISGLLVRGLLSGVIGQPPRGQAPAAPRGGDTLSGADGSTTPLLGDRTASSVARQILETYDVTHITPRQFSEMLQRMREAGLISEADFNELVKIRNDLNEAGVEPDEVVDLLAFYRKRLQRLELWGGEEDQATLNTIKEMWQKRLEWLEKVATARQTGVSSLALGMSAVALDEKI